MTRNCQSLCHEETLSKANKNNIFAVSVAAFLETRDDWVVSVTDNQRDLADGAWVFNLEQDPIFTFSVRAMLDGCQEVQPDWSAHNHRLGINEMGERFLAIETVEDAAAFLQRYGPLYLSEPYRGGTEPIRLSTVLQHVDRHKAFLEKGTVRATAKESLAVAQILGYQLGDKIQDQIFRDADFGVLANFALDTLDFYATTPLNLELPYRGNLVATAVCKTVEEGMRAFVFLSRLAGREYRRCGHCKKLFKKRTKRSRICGEKCMSAATSKRYNEEHRPTAAKPKGRSSSASNQRLKHSRSLK
jgi:hypothetical protein